MSKGLMLWTDDGRIAEQAQGHGLATQKLEAGSWTFPFERALVVGPGVAMPWHLVDAGFRFLERWEAAAPLSERDTAEDLGRAAERRQTIAVVRDLRVPVYACELLFVRNCEGGRALLEAWHEERDSAGDGPQNDTNVRLAFLRALYRVKPLFLALPRSWLREGTVAQQPTVRRVEPRRELVHVEIAPGRYVCCQPEEVAKYQARFERMRTGRRC